MKKILLLGSGELGKEFVISAKAFRAAMSLPATTMQVRTGHASGR
jgi:formate-dependent phosphoribosylglycinamide formyltransferase (GAR transformylase)